jgi:hypothetical protein
VEGKTMVNSIEERGRVRGLRELVRKLLEKKLGQLPQSVSSRFETIPPEQLEEIALSCSDANSLKELGLTDEG